MSVALEQELGNGLTTDRRNDDGDHPCRRQLRHRVHNPKPAPNSTCSAQLGGLLLHQGCHPDQEECNNGRGRGCARQSRRKSPTARDWRAANTADATATEKEAVGQIRRDGRRHSAKTNNQGDQARNKEEEERPRRVTNRHATGRVKNNMSRMWPPQKESDRPTTTRQAGDPRELVRSRSVPRKKAG